MATTKRIKPAPPAAVTLAKRIRAYVRRELPSITLPDLDKVLAATAPTAPDMEAALYRAVDTLETASKTAERVSEFYTAIPLFRRLVQIVLDPRAVMALTVHLDSSGVLA